MSNVCKAAQTYLSLGLSVIPIAQKAGDISASKRPLGRWKQYQTALATREQLNSWFNEQPHNIALLGGQVSGNMLWLDFDCAGSYRDWAKEYPDVSTTAPTQSTGKGYHVGVKTSFPTPGNQDLYFNGVHIGETRGEGGYIIAAPSVHGSGRLYEWLRPPWEAAFPVIDALADIGLMTRDKVKTSSNVGRRAAGIADTNGQVRGDRHPKVTATIGTVLGRLATTAKPGRNTELNRAAFTLAGFIRSGELSRNEIERMLTPVALSIGLDERETANSITSGTNAGEGAPLDVIDDLAPPRPPATKGDDTPPPPDLLPYPAADEGNAQAFMVLHGDSYLYTNELGWLHYNGKYWAARGGNELLNRAIVETLIERRTQAVTADLEPIVKVTRPSANNVRNCKYMLQSLLWDSIDNFDSDPDLLNCNNGVVNLKTGNLTPHSAGQRFTYCISTSYDPDADYSKWEQWLFDCVTPEGTDDGDGKYARLVCWLQAAFGYSLTGHTNEQCMFYIQGPPRAGKGLLLQTFNDLIRSPLSTFVQFDSFIQKRGGDNQNFDLAGLKPCRLLMASESGDRQILNAQRVKTITGDDDVRCAHKGKDFFSYRPVYKIWLSSNFKVKAQADDAGLWSRLRIIHFPNSYENREDYNLRKKLWAGKAGVLNWAVDGAIAWNKSLEKGKGLGRPKIIQDAVQEHRDENDTVAQFKEDRCFEGEEAYSVGAQLSLAYREWCTENGGTALGGRRFGEALRSKGFVYKGKKISGKNVKCWHGIGLNL